MRRRCAAGQRARIIGKSVNAGKVVLVLRYYFGEKVSDATWPQPIFPWVVASLGGPLRSFEIPTGKEAPRKMVIVVDDCELQPLDDDGAGQDESMGVDIPQATRRALARPSTSGGHNP